VAIADGKEFMKLRVIIPSYNAPVTIATQLETLGGQQGSEPWEIIAWDEGSTDEWMGIVGRHRECVPNIRIVDGSDGV
jgi:Glycosyl transferase family 2